jgi:predicted MFS family arabinose efflux permease
MFSAHWGLIVAYLPQRAELAGANVGLFFAADGLGVLLARLPSGWLADRMSPLPPILFGIAINIVGVALLLPQPTTPLLVASGVLTGAGAAFIVTPILVALSRRSDDSDRGSAFALFSAAFALALSLGSVGAAAVIDTLGFEVSLSILLVSLALSAIVALADRGLRERSAVGPTIPEAEVATVPQ